MRFVGSWGKVPFAPPRAIAAICAAQTIGSMARRVRRRSSIQLGFRSVVYGRR